jgi:hypothetical protein
MTASNPPRRMLKNHPCEPGAIHTCDFSSTGSTRLQRRVQIEPDTSRAGGKCRIPGQPEAAHAMRLEPVHGLDPLHGSQGYAGRRSHPWPVQLGLDARPRRPDIASDDQVRTYQLL